MALPFRGIPWSISTILRDTLQYLYHNSGVSLPFREILWSVSTIPRDTLECLRWGGSISTDYLKARTSRHQYERRFLFGASAGSPAAVSSCSPPHRSSGQPLQVPFGLVLSANYAGIQESHLYGLRKQILRIAWCRLLGVETGVKD